MAQRFQGMAGSWIESILSASLHPCSSTSHIFTSLRRPSVEPNAFRDQSPTSSPAVRPDRCDPFLNLLVLGGSILFVRFVPKSRTQPDTKTVISNGSVYRGCA